MPGARGPQVAREVEARWPGLPVLLMSGYPDPQEGDAAVHPDVDKPVSPSGLARAIPPGPRRAPSAAASAPGARGIDRAGNGRAMVRVCRPTSTSPPSAASSRAGPPRRCRTCGSASGRRRSTRSRSSRAARPASPGCAPPRTPRRRSRGGPTGARRPTPRFRGEAGRRLLRWSAPDWAYHDFARPRCARLALPDPAAPARAARRRALRGVRRRAQGGRPGRPLRARRRARLPHRERALRRTPRRPSS